MSGPINSIDQAGRGIPAVRQGSQTPGKTYSSNELAFERLLSERYIQQESKTGELQFSKHASARVEQRGIQLTDGLLEGLKDAVEKARDKGAKDIVVIGQQGAFIVNVPNNTVVTTMSPTEMKQNIFTNIDSAVII